MKSFKVPLRILEGSELQWRNCESKIARKSSTASKSNRFLRCRELLRYFRVNPMRSTINDGNRCAIHSNYVALFGMVTNSFKLKGIIIVSVSCRRGLLEVNYGKCFQISRNSFSHFDTKLLEGCYSLVLYLVVFQGNTGMFRFEWSF
jgi:hypothetical protein